MMMGPFPIAGSVVESDGAGPTGGAGSPPPVGVTATSFGRLSSRHRMPLGRARLIGRPSLPSRCRIDPSLVILRLPVEHSLPHVQSRHYRRLSMAKGFHAQWL